LLTRADPALGIVVAALGGAAVGLERQWSGHADGPRARFAGLRTFTLIGLLSGTAGWMWTEALLVPAVALLAGVVAITAAAYAAASRKDVDGTTEVAALVVTAAGFIAGLGRYQLASALVATTTLLLVEKTKLHALAARIDDVGLRAGVRFAVMALVFLPLLPEGPYGPLGGVRPRELWALVLFFSGLSFAGYVAREVVGPRHGHLVTGLLGGLVSSTSVTLTFARLSRAQPAIAGALAYGAVAANAMLYPRVLVALAVLNLPLAVAAASLLAPPAIVAIAVVAARALTRSRSQEDAPKSALGNPQQLVAALQMAAAFQDVMFVVRASERYWGASGVVRSAAVLGLTDVDALTVSVARGAHDTPIEMAAIAIAVGVLANTVLKAGIAVLIGRREFRVIAGGVLLVVAAAAAGVLWWRWP
jgi:uncharacterized membrane protein (DUF4010 family)